MRRGVTKNDAFPKRNFARISAFSWQAVDLFSDSGSGSLTGFESQKECSTKASAPDSRAAWLKRAGRLKPAKRVPFIERALRDLPKAPTKSNVFFRKRLLRLLDASRLEAGLVSPAELHKENSLFAEMDFKSAKINFRPRLREQE